MRRVASDQGCADVLVSADLAQAQQDLVPLRVQPDDLHRHLLPELDDVREAPEPSTVKLCTSCKEVRSIP